MITDKGVRAGINPAPTNPPLRTDLGARIIPTVQGNLSIYMLSHCSFMSRSTFSPFFSSRAL